tara:strand:- start:620 stop:1081 length:462 start_codon:yes stop_codon:yes gene_type:complete
MKQKIIYFHGLESKQGGSKTDFLAKKHYVLAPEMDYKDPNLFKYALELVNSFKPDLIVGSSMGGYFAYTIATHTKTPVVLLNPALHSRKFQPEGVYEGSNEVVGVMINGSEDDVIDPLITAKMLSKSIAKGQMKYYLGDHGHRTPLKIFEDYL